MTSTPQPDLFDTGEQISPPSNIDPVLPDALVTESGFVAADTAAAVEIDASSTPVKRKRTIRNKLRANLTDESYLSVKEVADRYGLSVPTIWRYLKSNESFPKPYKLKGGPTRWRLGDLRAYEGLRGAGE